MRAVITVQVEYHPGTNPIDRVTNLLDHAAGEYGIRSLTYEVSRAAE